MAAKDDEALARVVREFAGIRSEAAAPLRAFGEMVPHLRTIGQVLDWLDQLARPFGMRLLGFWEIPPNFAWLIDWWRLGDNLFLHRDLPPTFWPDYQKEYRARGYAITSIRARRDDMPFTFAEAEAGAKRRRQRNVWVFDLFRRYGFADGLYCNTRNWSGCFISDRQLVMGTFERLFVLDGVVNAVDRLGRIRMAGRRNREGQSLTDREIEVLQAHAIHGDAPSAARALGISPKSVETHLMHARQKLKVKFTSQALLTALKARLIEY